MTTTATLSVLLPVQVIEFDRIECGQCDRLSPFLDDEDQGWQDAFDAGWHVYNRDECQCPLLCPDCAEEWCGASDNSPRLIGMRVIG